MIKFLKDLSAGLLASVVLALVLELGLRLAGFQPAGIAPFQFNFYSPDPVVGFKCYPDTKWFFTTTPHGKATVRNIGTTQGQGFRPMIENADCADCPLIVVLGDSLTFGAESPDAETWPEFLAKSLGQKGK